MIRRSLLLLTPVLAAAALAIACSEEVDTGPTPGSDAGPEATTPTADAGTSTGVLPFTPSNIDLSGIDLSEVGDFAADTANCVIYAGQQLVTCGERTAIAFGIVDQPGAGQIGVYVARNFRVEPNARLRVIGTMPIAIVALENFDIRGAIDVGAEGDETSPGGFGHPPDGESKGSGQGGGGAGSSTAAGGGGSYCGIGGSGAGFEGAAASPGGTAYGTPENIPLVGGSAGGSGTLPFSGAGGGAMQLVAGVKFSLAATGLLQAGGGGGSPAGAVNTQHASGGGSGGAILIEAPTAEILGKVLANGGAGGSKEIGDDANDEGTAAQGDPQENGTAGGTGSTGASVNGGNGAHNAGDRASGGGGGAGRIRVNTTTGSGALTSGTIAPAAGACATEGTLRP